MKKFVTSFLLLIFLANIMTETCVSAETIWADDSINDDIVKIYNTNAINEEFLPALPDSLKKDSKKQEKTPVGKTEQTASTTNATASNQTNQTTKSAEQTKIPPLITSAKKGGKLVTLKRGTKFDLRIESATNDGASVGSKLYFTSLYPETNRYITIPSGSTFIGTVEDAHLPQISSNGGLLVIKVDKLVYNGHTYSIDANVIKVDSKHIFLNNIKGKHTYWQNVSKAAKPGIKFYNKAWRTTKRFAQDGLEIILTPITFTSGVVVLVATTFSSPIIAFFSKGGRLFVNKGTRFQIKLTEDAEIYI